VKNNPLHVETLESRETPALVGALDPSFGTAGLQTLNFGATDSAAAVAVQPDGKIVVAGTTDAGGGVSDIAVARYNPDGTLDLTFGNGTGTTRINFGASTSNGAGGVAIQGDGKIVIAGYTNVNGNDDFALVRLTSTGLLDTSFDGDGRLAVDFGFGTAERATAIAIQSDGKIVAGGSFSGGVAGSNFAFVRVNSVDGSLDNTFNGNGRQNATIGAMDMLTALAIDSKGRIVGAGYTDFNASGANTFDFALVRLLDTGLLDTTFDTDGSRTIDFGADDRATGIAIQADGNIVVGGTTDDGTAEMAFARVLSTNGALDSTFDTDGKATANLGAASKANGIGIQWDGRILAAGSSGTDFVLSRLNTDGSLDPNFNGTGFRTVDFGSAAVSTALAIDPNGRAVLVGSASAADFAIARITATVEEGRKLAAGGSLDGRAGVLTPTPTTGLLGAPASTPAGVFPGYGGAVRVAVGDVNGDGSADTALITGPGTPIRFAVVSGKDNSILVPATAPFSGSEDFAGGGFVAVADLDNDGRAEIIVTPDQGGGPRVTIFSLPAGGTVSVRANFLGIDDANFRGGARAAAGDVNGDGVQDLAVAAGFLGGPRIALFNGTTLFGTPNRLVGDFYAFPGADAVTLRNGSFVAVGDVNGDGFADLAFGGGPGGAPRVFVLSGALVSANNVNGAYNAPIANFFVAGNDRDRGGVRLATTDIDGDAKADLVVGTGEGAPAAIRAYRGLNFTTSGEPATFQDMFLFGGQALAGGVYVG
jgi:uncharacterized delta-60 repeat protein